MSIVEQNVSPSLEEFYADIEAANLPPLWKYLGGMITRQPVYDAVPFLWRWSEVYPRILQAGQVPIERGGERRVLILNNPGLSHLYTTTHNLYAGVQMVKPGEVAPAHRHTQSAIRFVIKGNGGYTAVEGERCYMEEYDLLLTPRWQWHDHGNQTTEPVIWMDGLDINLIRSLNASFFEPYPEQVRPSDKPDNNSLKTYGGGALRPAWQKPYNDSGSPLLIYKWAKTYEALQQLAQVDASPFDDVALTYTNPLTGGPVLPTISAWVQMLRPGVHTQAHRHTTSAVYHVIEGAGSTIINGQRFDWQKGDFLALPPWCWHEHLNTSSSPALLFSITDTPVLEAFGLYREEAYTDNGGHQPIVD